MDDRNRCGHLPLISGQGRDGDSMVTEASAPEKRIADALARRNAEGSRVGLVLGSGLGALADRIDQAEVVPYGEVDGMPESRVPGHEGRFVIGNLAGVKVIVQQGRVHLYEGWSADAVTCAVRSFALLGVESLFLTNAAGAIEPTWTVPGLMRIEDHINVQGISPLRTGESGFGSPYDSELGRSLDLAAERSGVELHRGTYVATLGPSYETAAEIRQFARMGAHAVGMSTVAEASAAHASGLRVAGVSCLTNPAAGVAKAPLNHEEVVEAGRAMADDLIRLLTLAVTLA